MRRVHPSGGVGAVLEHDAHEEGAGAVCEEKRNACSIANWTCIVLPSCAHRKPESWLLPAKVLFPTKYQNISGARLW